MKPPLTEGPVTGARGRLRRPLAPARYFGLSLFSFLALLVLWSLLTYSGWVDPLFLPPPHDVLADGVRLFTQEGFLQDVAITVQRVILGFLLAAAVGIPLGILIGVSGVADALLEPLISFARYMPASAFIPLLILWIGVGEGEKVAVIFLGSFFSLVLMVAVHVRGVGKELLETAYTLGASQGQVVGKIILPAAFPPIFDTLRIVLGWAWTYIIVAELVAAQHGIGHVILQSQRLLQTGSILVGILTIGLIGLISDLSLRALGQRLFSWREG
ncbi:MAG: ABC transporter permease [Bacillota bacterium]|nr:ABC transporter permease [Bacillota bacterium]